MFKSKLLFLSLQITVCLAGVPSFLEHELVPDILNVEPSSVLKVIFPSGIEILEGNVLTIKEVAGMPNLSWNIDKDQLYTIIFCDPDAPSRSNPEARSFLHWLVVNVEGGDLTTGNTLVNIINSHPEPGTGLHRYVFLVYRQEGVLDVGRMVEYNDSFESRKGFSPEEFSTKYNTGTVIAGNFYQTENLDED